MSKKYHVYALIKKGKAVYIGCTSNPRLRSKVHRRDKDFDKLHIIKSYKTNKEALIAENSIINFVTLFGDGDWYNAEPIRLRYERNYYIRHFIKA